MQSSSWMIVFCRCTDSISEVEKALTIRIEEIQKVHKCMLRANQPLRTCPGKSSFRVLLIFAAQHF